jgi:asparagine synthase (glutamine-hydrolysing)
VDPIGDVRRLRVEFTDRLLTLLAGAILRDSERSRNLGDWARRFVAGAAEPMPDRYINWTRFFGARELAPLATPALRAVLGGDVDHRQRAAWIGYGHGDPMDGAFRVDLATYLPDDLLTMADRMSMAHSLELRAPFCDHQLIETSLQLSPSLKAPRLRLKSLLKAAFADVLPAEILTRPKNALAFSGRMRFDFMD